MKSVRVETVRAFSLDMGLPENVILVAVQKMGIQIIGETNDEKNK